jgi:hypothetical protein
MPPAGAVRYRGSRLAHLPTSEPNPAYAGAATMDKVPFGIVRIFSVGHVHLVTVGVGHGRWEQHDEP